MATQQSWSEWLWSSYTNIVSPNTTTSTTTQSTSPDPNSANSNSKPSNSPYGPYVRTGRGGAGNFTWQSQADPTKNLEAQNPSALHDQRKAAASLEREGTDSALKSKAAQKPSEQYVRVGRNLVLRSDIQTTSDQDSNTNPVVVTSASASRVAHPGRGGAGNYAVAAELNEDAESARLKREEVATAQRREKIEEQMQSTLPAPPDAWLGGRRQDGKAS